MRAIDLKQAKRSLSTYAKMAFEAPVLLTEAGKPYVVMARAAGADLEDLAVGSSPAFLAVMERSEARYRAEGGLSTEEVRARLGISRRSPRQRTSSVRKERKAVAKRSRG